MIGAQFNRPRQRVPFSERLRAAQSGLEWIDDNGGTRVDSAPPPRFLTATRPACGQRCRTWNTSCSMKDQLIRE